VSFGDTGLAAMLKACMYMVAELAELIKFAKLYYPKFYVFTDEILEVFFLKYADSTIIRQNAGGEITGFCVFEKKADKVKMLIICLTGDPRLNFRAIRAELKKLGIKNVVWDKRPSNISCCAK